MYWLNVMGNNLFKFCFEQVRDGFLAQQRQTGGFTGTCQFHKEYVSIFPYKNPLEICSTKYYSLIGVLLW